MSGLLTVCVHVFQAVYYAYDYLCLSVCNDVVRMSESMPVQKSDLVLFQTQTHRLGALDQITSLTDDCFCSVLPHH